MTERKDETKWIGLQAQALEAGAAVAFLQDEKAGGINLFLGTTRGWTDGVETVRLEYESYEPMALDEMERLASEVLARWPARKVCVLHRLGLVPAGEASVLIGVATPHRAEAFEACRYLIDRLKQQVPIWKREVFRDGSTVWVEGNAPEIRP